MSPSRRSPWGPQVWRTYPPLQTWLLSERETEGEPIEHVGELLAIVDDDLNHVATVRVTKVEVCRFADVPDDFAVAEAEGDSDTADSRASHHTFWTSVGKVVDDDTMVATVYFDLLADVRRSEPDGPA